MREPWRALGASAPDLLKFVWNFPCGHRSLPTRRKPRKGTEIIEPALSAARAAEPYASQCAAAAPMSYETQARKLELAKVKPIHVAIFVT